MKYWFCIFIFASASVVQAGDFIFVDRFEFIPVPRITVVLDDAAVPPEMAGGYDKAFNCSLNEGGANFSGVDHSICFRKTDGSSWRIWNTGCGWEIGRQEDEDDDTEWQRYARSYSGLCSEMPSNQISTRVLIDNTSFFDRSGNPITGVLTELCEHTNVEVITTAESPVPSEMAGTYDKAFDCTLNEGGGSGSGVDSEICFRKIDGSLWRIWNTGCGWEIGRQEEDDDDFEWQRYARSYTGQCSEMPPVQIDTRALSTHQYVNGFGDPLEGVESRRFESDRCEAP